MTSAKIENAIPKNLLAQMSVTSELLYTVLELEETRADAHKNRFTPPPGFTQKFKKIIHSALDGDSDIDARSSILKNLKDLSAFEMELLVRAINILFNLWNTAEKVEIIERVGAKRSQNQAVPFSIRESLHLYQSWPEVKDALENQLFELVTTSHPTEFRNKEMLNHLADLALSLKELREGKSTGALTLSDRIRLLWNTDELRKDRPTVEEEKERDLEIFRRSLFTALPDGMVELEEQLCRRFPEDASEITAFLHARQIARFRTWSGGGDRDGNPDVTHETTRWGARRHWQEAVALHTAVIDSLTPLLTITAQLPHLERSVLADLFTIVKQNAPSELGEFIKMHKRILTDNGLGDIDSDRILQAKLYCMKYSLQRFARLDPFNSADLPPYTKEKFLSDYQELADAISVCGIMPDSEIAKIIRKWSYQIEIFGLSLSTMDLRQNTRVTRRVVGEVLELHGICKAEAWKLAHEDSKIRFIEDALKLAPLDGAKRKSFSKESRELFATFLCVKTARRYDPHLFKPFILSLTSDVSDLLGVLLLLKEAELELDIVPLTETIPDLARAGELFEAFVQHPAYATYLKRRGNFQQWMIGPSDSNKDGGVISATLSLHEAQGVLAHCAGKFRIDLQIFMGIGSSAARGGSTLEDVIMSSPGICSTTRRALTLQGERKWVFHFPELVRHELDKALGALLVHHKKGKNFTEEDFSSLKTMGKFGESVYRSMIQDPDYWRFFTSMTPIWGLAFSTFCQRPLCREGKELTFEDLRAIPHVAANAQVRTNFSAIYSAGAALREGLKIRGSLQAMQRMYQTYPFFKNFLDTLYFEQSKARFDVTRLYGSSPVVDRMEQDSKWLIESLNAVRGDSTLSREIKLKALANYRSRITDIINIVQSLITKEILSAQKTGGPVSADVPAILYRTILAQTAGLQQVG